MQKKLDVLLQLQTVDSKKDAIKELRGSLPEEVEALGDEVLGYQSRVGRRMQNLEAVRQEIEGIRVGIKDAEQLIARYEEQKKDVKNNREFEAVSKEIELQQLNIQIFERKIKEGREKVTQEKEDLEALKEQAAAKNKRLEEKRQDLERLLAESQEEEDTLDKQRARVEKRLDKTLLEAYKRLRGNAKNGLAVVVVKRGACGGCFTTVPPQRQAEIKQRQRLILCEHCGRILANVTAEEIA